MSQLPTALFLFTDAHGCRLPNLPLEANAVQDLFAWCSDRVVYAPHRYNFARRDLANSLAADANTLALFHIAGHNTPEGILVTNDDSSETILSAKILNAYLDTCENLQLVFLNACQSLATAAQLSAKPLVRIGTVIDIDDNAAADASRLFYHAMLKGQNLKTAFDLLNARYKEITDTDSNAYTALWKNDAAQTVVLFAAKKGTENTTETGDIILGNKIVNYYASTDAPSIAKLPPISRLAPILLDENGMLIGRKNALDALQKHIDTEPNDLVLIESIGGIGKTTLARAYCTLAPYTADYTHYLWLTVLDEKGLDKKQRLPNALQLLLDVESLRGKTGAALAQAIAIYLNEFDGKKLLVIDNMNDADMLTESLSFLRSLQWRVIVTTRCDLPDFPRLRLENLAPADAAFLFRQYAKPSIADYESLTVQTKINTLLENVSYHTLLIEFMAKSLRSNDAISLDRLIEITSKSDFTNEFLRFATFTTEHAPNTGKTNLKIQPHQYLLEIFATDNLTDAEGSLLRYFSVLPPTPMTSAVLLPLFGFAAETDDYMAAAASLKALVEKGWLQESANKAYACHPLLQHILRVKLNPTAENCAPLIDGAIAASQYYSGVDGTKQAYLLPILTKLPPLFDTETEKVARMYNNIASILQYIGQYNQALEHNLKAIDIRKKVLTENHPDLATSYGNIGLTYERLGDYDQALKYHLKAIDISEKGLAEKHPDLAASYNNIGLTYECLGDYEKSLAFNLKAIAICEKVLTENHPDLAASYNNIAITYEKVGDYNQALAFNLKAIAICEKVLTENHPNLAASYNNIASTYECLGDYEKSLAFNLKAIAICEEVLTENHPNLAASYNNIAVTYYYLKDYQQAADFMQKAIDIRRLAFPNGHPDLDNSIASLAAIKAALT